MSAVTPSTTNVAVYTETEDGEVRLTSPVKLAKNVKGEQMYYTNDALQGEKDTTDRGYDHRACADGVDLLVVGEVVGLLVLDVHHVELGVPSQTSGSVKRLETYNSESENPRIDMILDSGSFDWAPRYNGSWVYEIDEDKIEDGDLYANKAVRQPR